MSNGLVVKSNRLIEAGYRLTLVEQRLILMAIVEARKTGKGISGEDFVRITAADYANEFDADESSAYAQIREAEKSLFSRQFIIYQTDPESGHREVIRARWLSASSYIDGAGAIRLQFSQAIVPFITRLEAEFTRYKLEKVAKMSSAYAIRLYELLMQWGSVGRREVELEWLRRVFRLENEYSSIRDFKKWVIDVALSQINEHSDLTASYAQRKTGRNVSHFIFTFAPKEPPAAPAQEPPPAAEDSALVQRLRALGISAKLAREWIKQDAARAQAAAEYVEAKVKAGQVQGRAAGYLREVFESGAAIGPSAFEAGLAEKARAAAEAARRAVAAEAEAKQAKAAQLACEREETARAMAWFESLPESDRLAAEAAFRQNANWADADLFKKHGHASRGFGLFVKSLWKQAA